MVWILEKLSQNERLKELTLQSLTDNLGRNYLFTAGEYCQWLEGL